MLSPSAISMPMSPGGSPLVANGLPNFSSDRVCTLYVRQPTYAAKRKRSLYEADRILLAAVG
jgi:hypothetical protein